MTHAPFPRGYILLLSLVFLGIFSAVATALLSSVTSAEVVANRRVMDAQARAVAEGALDSAIYALNQDSSYTGASNVALGPGAYSVSVSSVTSDTKQITITASIPATNPMVTKTLKAQAHIDSGAISFHYGVQAGAGGFNLSGGSTIHGSVYANGNIVASGGVHITGSAIAANPPAASADQANDSPTPISSCPPSTCIVFGNSTATQSFAQSFTISQGVALASVDLYVKKTGSPSDRTIRIVTDNNGKPSDNSLMSATLSASLVTSTFGWVTIAMPSTPILAPGTTYWLVVDGSSNSSKYFTIGANTAYANGTAKVGKYSSETWSNTSPAGLDGYFRITLGGGTSMIGGANYTTGLYVGTSGSDSAWAHTVQGTTVSGPLYCQTSSYTNKSCSSSAGDPSPQAMPLSDSNIAAWEADASAGGTIASGNYTVGWQGATLGPGIINGNLTVNGGGTLTVTGTLWIKGNLSVTSGGSVKLASSYGSSSGAIVVDGTTSLTGGSNFAGSGTSGSYPFIISNSACPAAAGCDGADAIYLSGGSGTVALVAQNGSVHISGGAALKAVTAALIIMDGGSTLYYDSGLISTNFSSGPGGSWQFVPGSYGFAP